MSFHKVAAQRAVFSAIVSAFLGTCAYASSSVSDLDTLVVTASRVQTPLSKVLVSLDVIDRQEIERSQASSLADLLSGLSGFEFGRNGGPGTTTSFFLRGHNSVNVVVLIDGIRATTDGIGSISAIDIPLHRVERVEVLRGNASALYGNAANGGVIHILTRKEQGVSAQVGFGDRGSQTVNLGLATSIDRTHISLRAGQDRSAKLSAMRIDQKPKANPDNDQTISDTLAIGLEHEVSNDHRLKMNVSVENAKSQYDDDKYEFGSSDPADKHLLVRKTEMMQLSLISVLTSKWSSELSLTHTSQNLDDRKNGVLRTWDYGFGLAKSAQYGLRWSNDYKLSPSSQLVFGLDYSQEDFKSDAVISGYNTRKTDVGYFSGLSYERNALSLQANYRHDRLSTLNRRSQTTLKDSEDSFLLGMGYQVNPQWKIVANAATGFRAPAVGERASSSVNLRNESFRTFELGGAYRLGSTKAKLVFFDSKMSNLVAYNKASRLVNLEAENSGYEATAESTIGPTLFKASWTEQKPKNLDTGKQLARRAKRLVSLDLIQPIGQHTLGLTASYQGKRRDSDFTEQHLESYTVLGLNGSYQISKQWRLVARLENMLNKDYQLAYGYNTPGRSAFVTLNYSDR
jgi:vitamin B12 transporter